MIDTRFGACAPETWPEQRLCAEIPTEVFFPDLDDRAGIQAAQAICQACPALGRCAGWAVELVGAGLLTDGVVASVRLPRSGITRTDVVERLREIATAAGVPVSEREAA